jgi:hypothetical protein
MFECVLYYSTDSVWNLFIHTGQNPKIDVEYVNML